MNKRIRKKKAKQQLIRAISGLVEAAEEMQREQERRTRQAGISYIKYSPLMHRSSVDFPHPLPPQSTTQRPAGMPPPTCRRMGSFASAYWNSNSNSIIANSFLIG